tara:strand:+ start:1031 stop:1207 length:177 start_codon:yes stop_codon:yes gene_type:complete
MTYLVTISGNTWREPNKDEVIARLLAHINGDGVVMVRVDWPDGSWLEMEGDDAEYRPR